MGKLRALFASMFFKLFLALALASLLVLSGLLYSALSSSREALMLQKSEDMTMFINRNSQYLDLYLQNIRNILISFSDRMNEELMDNPNELERMLKQQVERNSGIISYMFVLQHDGTIISSNQLLFGVVGHPMLPELFHIADESPGLVNWSEPYYSPLLTDRTIAFGLELKNGAGVILAEVNMSYLTRWLYELLHNSGQAFTLFSGQGNIVSYDPNSKIVPYIPATLPPEIDHLFAKTLTGLPSGISRISGVSGSLMAVKSKQNELGWYLVTLTDERDFGAGTRKLFIGFLGIGALWFSLLIILTFAISRHFTTPINQLAMQVDRIRGDRFVAPYRQIERSDEIGRLSRSFYTMLGRIQDLLATVRENEERKKAMELELLLHQIRPHFLYNTLACIGSLAKQHRVAEVEETIRALIGLLSYSIGKNDFMTLEEELKALREYMQIQNVKYGNTLRLIENIDPTLSQVSVLKLLLQPLVENAIFHGLSGKGEGEVFIHACKVEKRMLLTVWDDGAGMTEEQITAAIAPDLLFKETVDKKAEYGRFNRIGLLNVQERIQLNYGQEFGLQIRSEFGRWTEVTVILPLP